MKPRNLRLSNSWIKDYEQCPLLFFYRHILKLQLDKTGVHLHFGKALHRALELYQKEKADLITTFKQEFLPAKISDEETAKYLELRVIGQELLRQFPDSLANKIEVTKTEEKLTFAGVVDPASKEKLLFTELTGVIDFETKDNRLGDYKTSGKPYTQEKVDSELQPTIYYLLYYLEHGKLPEGFIYVVFNKKRKRDAIQILETHRTLDDITAFILRANELYGKIERNEFERVHPEFERCDCYEYQKAVEI